MIQLQNDYTTPEQSKRLLNLGVPADSADCYYLREHPDKVYLFKNQKESDNCISKIRLRLGLGHAMPCWSVGRLIEILMICGTYLAPKEFKIEPNSMNPTLIENAVNKIEELEGYDMLDFSKLED